MDMMALIAAMMNQRPQVDQASPRRMSGGGGGGGFTAPQPTMNLSMPRSSGRPEANIPEMPEISDALRQSAMQQQQQAAMQYAGPESLPGMPGSQQQGPPDPNAMMGRGTDIVTALQRQYFDAAEEVERYTQPTNLRDAWKAREKLPEAREHLAQAQANFSAANAEAEAAAEARAAADRSRNVYDLVLPVLTRELGDPKVAHEKATTIADQAGADPKVAEQVIESVLAREATLSERAHAQSEELKTEQQRYEAYSAYGIPDDVAVPMAQNEDTSIQDGVKLYYEQQGIDAATQQRRWETMTFQGQQMDKIDNSIRQADRTLENISPWSAGFASLSKIVPGLPAYDLMTQLDTQRATIAFRELIAMREASKTGGALGNVSNREIELLYSSFAPLKEGMSPSELRTSVNDILNNFEQIKWILKNEAKYQQQVESGQMTIDEASKAMREERNMAVNQSMAERNRTPQEALQYLQENPDTIKNFEEEFGWRPNV